MLPKMILFDYGQTLLDQDGYHTLEGYEAVMKYITYNPQNVTAEQLTALAKKIYQQCGTILGAKKKRHWHMEVPQRDINHYIMEYFGLKSDKSDEELSVVYWDAACNGVPIQDIEKLLEYVNKLGIRTGVLSNLSFSGEALKQRLNRLIPQNHFEFYISSTDVIFRKPEPAIFELAIAKSGLRPDEIWYCGDDTVWDIESSYEVGMTPVWFRGALDYEQPIPTVDHIVVENYKELIDVLKHLKR